MPAYPAPVQIALDEHDYGRLLHQARRNGRTLETQAYVYICLSLEDDEQREDEDDE